MNSSPDMDGITAEHALTVLYWYNPYKYITVCECNAIFLYTIWGGSRKI